jgi:hypothetical protein
MPISDTDVQAALDHLRFKASEAAKAKANRIFLEEFGKILRSRIMQRDSHLPVSAQERNAYASPEYETHLNGLRAAIEDDETYRWKMIAASALIDAWRTEQSNMRSQGKIG